MSCRAPLLLRTTTFYDATESITTTTTTTIEEGLVHETSLKFIDFIIFRIH